MLLEEELQKTFESLKFYKEKDYEMDELSKICSEISVIKSMSLAILSNKTDNLDFIDSYLSETKPIALSELHNSLIKALSDLSSIKSNLFTLI